MSVASPAAGLLGWAVRTLTYSMSGPTASATLPGSVQGVVVQART